MLVIASAVCLLCSALPAAVGFGNPFDDSGVVASGLAELLMGVDGAAGGLPNLGL